MKYRDGAGLWSRDSAGLWSRDGDVSEIRESQLVEINVFIMLQMKFHLFMSGTMIRDDDIR